MITLKEILKEENGEELERLLDTEFKVYEEPLYRGSRRNIEEYEIRSPRTDRSPKDTAVKVQEIVHYWTQEYFPSHPDRKKSKFAATSIKEANRYGDPYYFFPYKDAKVSFYKADTFQMFFSEANYALKQIKENIDDYPNSRRDVIGHFKEKYESYEDVLDFIDSFWRYVKLYDGMELLESFERYDHYNKLIRRVISFSQEGGVTHKMRLIAENISHLLKQVRDYFTNGRKGFLHNAEEVVVEGDYLVCDIEFLNNRIGKETLWDV